MATTGIIVNPWAGKDVRRFHAPVGHSPDTAKISTVRRIAAAALDSGATQVLVAGDASRIAERAVQGLAGSHVVAGPGTGSALDTRRAAQQLCDLGCSNVVVLGGDGTCRDVAIGWPSVAMIAVSTGTNNVFPRLIDGSSAGAASGLVACGAVPLGEVAAPAKLLHVVVTYPDGSSVTDIALVDVAYIDVAHTGARAVVDARTIRAVVAAIANPTSTGLSSIAGRVLPLDRQADGAVVVCLGPGGRQVRVPIIPGSTAVLPVANSHVVGFDTPIDFQGPGVLAYDGERDRVLPPSSTATVTVRRDGPLVIDVDLALRYAAVHQLFDLQPQEAPDGD